MHTAKLNPTTGNYEVYKDGGLITTGTESVLGNYGLSKSNLGGLAPSVTPTDVNPNPPMPSQPTTEILPGIGTLTKTPKVSLASAGVPTPQPNALDNASGLYERTGTTPPPSYTVASGDTLSAIASKSGMSLQQILALNPSIKDPNKIQAGMSLNLGGGAGKSATLPDVNPNPPIPGLPSYPNSNTETPQNSILDSYNALLKNITTIEDKIKSNTTPSAEEQQLAKDLADKKAQLATFDVGLETRVNNLYGQGRGATTGNLSLQETQERRTSALERLGLATEANTLVDQLSIAKQDRANMSDEAKTEYDLASKRLDISLGVQKEIETLNEKQKDDARQYLLDVVSFAGSKTYDQLDPATQTAITHAVANSPITLDMVRTALKNASEKAKATANGDIRSVTGLGVVQIDPSTGKYKVIIPEQPNTTTFSTTQLNSGAANAGVSPEIFKTYDENTKNVFINGDLNGSKKIIDNEIKNGTTGDEILTGIKNLQLPAQVGQYLTTYAQGQIDQNKPLTPEEQKTSIVSTIKALQTSGYSRSEAENTVRSELTDGGKTTLPGVIDGLITDAMVDVYGKTFWQKIIPGGE